MRLRVVYKEYLEFGGWYGEYYDDILKSWYNVTNICWTKWGAKRELLKWYKHKDDQPKIEEINFPELVLGNWYKISKSISNGTLVIIEAGVLIHMGYSVANWEWWVIILLTICYRLLETLF